MRRSYPRKRAAWRLDSAPIAKATATLLAASIAKPEQAVAGFASHVQSVRLKAFI